MKDGIKVGDEVKWMCDGDPYSTAVITYIRPKVLENTYVDVVWKDGSVGEGYNAKYFRKTGRTFPITEMLEQMKGAITDGFTASRMLGRWIIIDEHTARCSLCKHIQTTNGADKTGKGLIFKANYKFCPNCGCWMKGVKE